LRGLVQRSVQRQPSPQLVDSPVTQALEKRAWADRVRKGQIINYNQSMKKLIFPAILVIILAVFLGANMHFQTQKQTEEMGLRGISRTVTYTTSTVATTSATQVLSV